MGTLASHEVITIILRKATITLFLAMLFLGEALADNLDKLYIAGNIGYVSYTNMSNYPNTRSIQISAGKRFTRNFAGEVTFVKFGDSKSIAPTSGGADKLSASALQLSAIGSYSLDEKIEIIGKVGLSINRASGNNSGGTSAEKSHTAILLGVGQMYHITPQFAFRLQFEDFGAFERASNPMKATVFSLGVVYDLR